MFACSGPFPRLGRNWASALGLLTEAYIRTSSLYGECKRKWKLRSYLGFWRGSDYVGFWDVASSSSNGESNGKKWKITWKLGFKVGYMSYTQYFPEN